MTKALEIEAHMYDPIQKNEFDTQIKEFSHFSKQMLPLLKTMLKEVQSSMVNTA